MNKIETLKVSNGLDITIFFDKIKSRKCLNYDISENILFLDKSLEGVKELDISLFDLDLKKIVLDNGKIEDISYTHKFNFLENLSLKRFSQLNISNLDLNELHIVCSGKSFLHLKKVKANKVYIEVELGSEVVLDNTSFYSVEKIIKDNSKIKII